MSGRTGLERGEIEKMAEVTITITGKQSSRVKVRFNPGTRNATNLTMNTKWSKDDWEAMLTDDDMAAATAKTMGTNVDHLRAGIAKMTETTRHLGPAVYRAFCGSEVYDRTDGTTKPKRIPELLVGWKGDDRSTDEERRVDRPVPERCSGCPKLKAQVLNFMVRDDYPGEMRDPLFRQTLFVCKTFSLVPGAIPPEVAGEVR